MPRKEQYRPIGRAFYKRPTAELAPDLLGRLLVRVMDDGPILAGRIVETEAYLGENDPACHSVTRGGSPATSVIWGPPGHAYVYLSYGFYPLLNIVAETAGMAGCVLIRALEPVEGIERMRQLRPKAKRDTGLCNGPGKLCQALGIGLDLNGWDMTRGTLFVDRSEPAAPPAIETSGRIGITKAVDLPLRFMVAGSAYISNTKPGRGGEAKDVRIR